jgi:hypothetical protein
VVKTQHDMVANFGDKNHASVFGYFATRACIGGQYRKIGYFQ